MSSKVNLFHLRYSITVRGGGVRWKRIGVILVLGYVLDCLPSFDETWKSVPEQIKFLKTLPQPPTVIINLKVRRKR